MLAAVSLMKLFGLSLNLFSLGGLALGIGQAIDTSVVILENISEGDRHDSGAASTPSLEFPRCNSRVDRP
jgi:Cu/Ag efflux pump CusA